MSGHSKWHSIKHKKAAEDAKKGKIFTKQAKLVAIAARGGGDPSMNPTLRMAVENARAENMPYDNIERAIKKGSGEGKDAVSISEIMYEGFGSGGVALYIETITDNSNRTFSNVKLIVSKKGGHLGAAGSVGYLFSKKGMIEVLSAKAEEAPAGAKAEDDIELAAIDAGATDVKVTEEGMVEIYTDPQSLMQVKTQLEKVGVKVEAARLTYVPLTEVVISDAETAQKLMDLIDAVEEDEDVSMVYSNAKFEV